MQRVASLGLALLYKSCPLILDNTFKLSFITVGVYVFISIFHFSFMFRNNLCWFILLLLFKNVFYYCIIYLSEINLLLTDLLFRSHLNALLERTCVMILPDTLSSAWGNKKVICVYIYTSLMVAPENWRTFFHLLVMRFPFTSCSTDISIIWQHFLSWFNRFFPNYSYGYYCYLNLNILRNVAITDFKNIRLIIYLY